MLKLSLLWVFASFFHECFDVPPTCLVFFCTSTSLNFILRQHDHGVRAPRRPPHFLLPGHDHYNIPTTCFLAAPQSFLPITHAPPLFSSLLHLCQTLSCPSTRRQFKIQAGVSPKTNKRGFPNSSNTTVRPPPETFKVMLGSLFSTLHQLLKMYDFVGAFVKIGLNVNVNVKSSTKSKLFVLLFMTQHTCVLCMYTWYITRLKVAVAPLIYYHLNNFNPLWQFFSV